jgi:hypothetical protein
MSEQREKIRLSLFWKTIDDAMLWLPDFHFYRSRASGLKINALNAL